MYTQDTRICFTNLPSQNITSGVASVSVADHLMNFVIIPKKVKTNKHKFIASRNFKKLDVKALLRQLDKLPWTVIEVFDNIDDCWHVWKTLFNSVVDELCPMKKFRPRKKTCPWYSEEIETLKILRDQLHNRAILTNDSDDWSKWKKM